MLLQYRIVDENINRAQFLDCIRDQLVTVPARVKVVVASIMQPTAEYRGEPNAPL